MKRIFKYQLNVEDEQFVKMPAGAAIITVQVQKGSPCIWAEVDPDAAIIKRKFITYGTGHPMCHGEAKYYVGTYQVLNGHQVFHVYTDRKEYTE